MCVLNVHDLIADVIGRLNEEAEWMTSHRFHAETRNDTLEGVLLRLEIAELRLGGGLCAGVWILDDRCQRTISQGKTTLAMANEMMGQQTEGVGIAIEMCEVGPLLLRQDILKATAFTLAEI